MDNRVEEAKELLLRLATATYELEKMILAPDGRKIVKLAGELLADDPAHTSMQGFFLAMKRGVAASRSGMTAGEAIDKEMDRHLPDKDA